MKVPATSAWPIVEADLRRALLASGRPASVVDRVVADLAPVFAAVERARGRVDDELTFALLAVVADRARRHAQHVKRERQRIVHRSDASSGVAVAIAAKAGR